MPAALSPAAKNKKADWKRFFQSAFSSLRPRLQSDRFGRAAGNASAAFDAAVANNGFVVFDGDSAERAAVHASTAADTGFLINRSSHFLIPF